MIPDYMTLSEQIFALHDKVRANNIEIPNAKTEAGKAQLLLLEAANPMSNAEAITGVHKRRRERITSKDCI